jgi:hypothetical protein
MDDRELTRLADIGAAARPDWNHRSLRTFLAANLASKAFADVAVALVIVAVQPENQTPRLLLDHGPWWQAAGTAFRRQTETPGPGAEPACDRAGHEHELARNCRACAAERLADTDADDAPMHAASAPPDVVAVAERHRRREPSTTTGRDFAQPLELRPPAFDVARCGRCGGFYLPDDAGTDSHRTVFGHVPERSEPETGAEVDGTRTEMAAK